MAFVNTTLTCFPQFEINLFFEYFDDPFQMHLKLLRVNLKLSHDFSQSNIFGLETHSEQSTCFEFAQNMFVSMLLVLPDLSTLSYIGEPVQTPLLSQNMGRFLCKILMKNKIFYFLFDVSEGLD